MCLNRPTFRKCYLKEPQTQGIEKNRSAKLLDKIPGPFKGFSVQPRIPTIEKHGIIVTVSQDRVTVAALTSLHQEGGTSTHSEANGTTMESPAGESDMCSFGWLVRHRRHGLGYHFLFRWFGYIPKDDEST